MDHMKTESKVVGLDLSGSRYRFVAGCCEKGNKPSNSI